MSYAFDERTKRVDVPADNSYPAGTSMSSTSYVSSMSQAPSRLATHDRAKSDLFKYLIIRKLYYKKVSTQQESRGGGQALPYFPKLQKEKGYPLRELFRGHRAGLAILEEKELQRVEPADVLRIGNGRRVLVVVAAPD